MARRIFEEAMALPESRRAEFLAGQCQGDPEMEAEVARLIAAKRSQPESFLGGRTEESPRLGRYIIGGKLGAGAMGIVYEAWDPQMERKVAIKVINLAFCRTEDEFQEMRDRLFREARAASKLSHPGIVVVHDADTDQQVAYIVMELVEGPPLDKLEQRPAAAESAEIVRQAAAALDHAHGRGIVHRDIKPANIMLHGKDRQVKITDFGIAKITFGPKMTATGEVLGTPQYMSPEQIDGLPVDGKSDQFSLAVVAYELLTGAPPFQAESISALTRQIVSGPRPSARAANPALPMAVDEVLRRGMGQHPEQRYASCAEFAGALGRALRSAPAGYQETVRTVRPPSRWRSRLLAGGLAAAVLALGAVGYHAYLGRGTATTPTPLVSQPASGSQPAAPPPMADRGGDNGAPAATTDSPQALQPVSAEAPESAQAAQSAAASSGQAASLPNSRPGSAPPSNPPPPAAQAYGAAPVAMQGSLSSSAPAAKPPQTPGGTPGATGGSQADGAVPPPVFNPNSPKAMAPPSVPPGLSGPARAATLYQIGRRYETGDGVARNENEAIRYYQQAAAAGNPDALARLARLPKAAVRPPPITPPSVEAKQPGAISVQVAANVPWTDTGVNVNAGDSVLVTASGQISVSSNGFIPAKAPGGFAPDCSAAGAIYRTQFGVLPAPRLPCWSLIGKIGGTGVFEVGMRASFQARSSGRLFLGVNDDSFADNSGLWIAWVSVERAR
jgi:serine/threonine-protein kinase